MTVTLGSRRLELTVALKSTAVKVITLVAELALHRSLGIAITFVCVLSLTSLTGCCSSAMSSSGNAACLEGLLFDTGSHERTETRAGVPIYGGSASGFAEWELKVLMRCNAAEAEKDEAVRAQKIVELSSSSKR